MKVFLLASCLLCLGIVLVGPARAEFREFPDFSIDLPPGWDILREGATVAFIAADKSATMVVTVEYTADTFFEGMSAEELAEAYAEEFNGSRPVKEDPRHYSFTFTSPGGTDSEASLIIMEKSFCLITISGKNKDLVGMVESVLLSIM
jgi:hypothetical protein